MEHSLWDCIGSSVHSTESRPCGRCGEIGQDAGGVCLVPTSQRNPRSLVTGVEGRTGLYSALGKDSFCWGLPPAHRHLQDALMQRPSLGRAAFLSGFPSGFVVFLSRSLEKFWNFLCNQKESIEHPSCSKC